MDFLKLTTLTMTALLLSTTPVLADELIIIHKSGKIQTIQIDSSSDPIDQVSFRRINTTPVPAPVPPTHSGVNVAPSAAPPTQQTTARKATETAKAPEKAEVKIKWAQPMDAKY